MTLCPPCAAESAAWLNYRPPTLIRLTGAQTLYDQSARGRADARKAAYDDLRRTIRTQQKLIADACARNHLPTAANNG